MANVSSSDLVQLMERWWASSSVTTTASASIAALALAAYCYPSFTQDSKTIRHVGRLPLVTAWTFFSKRYDFLMSSFRETGSNIFKFNVLHHQVVALQGEEGRKVFFNDKSLDFTEGYRILMGGAPRLEEIDKAGEGTDDVSWFNKHLATLLRKERLADGKYTFSR
ncbi:hypothetical protein PUNSTDRAFT_143902 [Punctularia strigosozonata HHB-11173 SS5]|uniref:uncharacterized protein n=1 Tax=Punctularia strigosozonata (strain HHB-11173) TaxID=741275 RepID=UPI0004416AF3|nr:uncharacterized protein PUNSTDRAFT_143902 [Punctularia strigosozonata HHB-11173 SS5]EIN08262.1 hypothetical protein PUNSTDRAFT_143902 [Punctularia strigosozonata HHB-11173 SS5]